MSRISCKRRTGGIKKKKKEKNNQNMIRLLKYVPSQAGTKISPPQRLPFEKKRTVT